MSGPSRALLALYKRDVEEGMADIQRAMHRIEDSIEALDVLLTEVPHRRDEAPTLRITPPKGGAA